MKKRLIFVLMGIVVVMSSTGCGAARNNVYDDGNAKDSISIYVGTSIFDSSLDPTKGAMSYGYSFINNALIKVNPQSKYVGDLAEEWTVSDDSLEYTFNLKKGVKFHDDSDFTAEDVVFTYEKVKNNQGENENVDLSKLESVEAMDDYTVKFTLSEPYSPFLDTVAYLGIVPSDSYDSDEFDEKPIGTGPWKVKQYDTKQQIIVEANDNYYDGAPEIKNANIVNMDSEAAFSNAKSGQLDVVMVGPNYSKEKVDGMTINNLETMDVRNISLPCQKPQTVKDSNGNDVKIGNEVTSDKAVRKALSIGIDRESIINNALNGVGKKAVGFTDNLAWGGVDDYLDNRKDEAENILEEAGWKDTDNDGIREKDNIKCEFNVLAAANDMQRYLLASALAEEAEKIGIKINAKQKSWDEIYNSTYTEPVVWGWGQYNPILIKQLFYSDEFLKSKTGNVVAYSNKQADNLIDEAVNTNSQEKAVQKWKEVQMTVNQDYPYLYIVNIEHSFFISDKLDISKDTQIPHPHGHGSPIICNMKDWKIKW
ncbi:ABC transporter substrate-binding protein [uncultured Clostridium sp.]|uniref:ABC transporter substrate-binding protein n=1 Tax=uncultured Clostridium sp. TaxID=59620 RepID=UPI0025EE7126|nr:ABC transporter substrate-binding protein [uncultured Clostridium sp.]